MPLLFQAQSADPGNGVEYPASINNLPVEGIRNSRIAKFQAPEVSLLLELV